MPEISHRPRLPWDVLLLVFQQADPSTLAVLGPVSYEFLASTTPELYSDVELTSVKQLEGLFSERKVVQAGRKTKNSSKSSRINPHLSLSQIQTLSIDLTSLTSLPDTLSISSSRIDDASPISLHHLRISLDHRTSNAASLLYSYLLHLLNPSRCSYKVEGEYQTGIPWLNLSSLSLGGIELVGWTRLEELHLANTLPYAEAPNPLRLAGLPTPTLDRRRVVRIRFPDPYDILAELGPYSILLGLNFMQEGSFVFVVGTEEERERLANAVRTEPKIAKWRDVFAVEVAIQTIPLQPRRVGSPRTTSSSPLQPLHLQH